MRRSYILTASCPDRIGIIAAVSGLIARLGGSILEASQHADAAAGWFFMRYEIDATTLAASREELAAAIEEIAGSFAMRWQLNDSARPKRVLVLASRTDHCLADLIYRWRSGTLPGELVGVVSNHTLLAAQVEAAGLAFHHVPVTAERRLQAFEAIERIFEALAADVMVLARYMQILPPPLCARLSGRIINIHHSFLPSFVGANPYRQAYERGVKIIGATCHYVTEALDAGPIIEQDVVRIHHGDTVERLIALGQDVEKNVLARGLRYHLEDRVLRHGNKTVVFA
ncbi:MAG: formyltetrahydrofolate deformylase [Pseudomonadota bacterium]|nr:formyltetrahydrofolate deformylase [Pseudomonadota bacterium]HJO35463.1 formyltetrahydrofolate deformylase [Gammaproteobacteria bacterium]